MQKSSHAAWHGGGLWEWEAVVLLLFRSQTAPFCAVGLQPHPDTLHPALLQQTLTPAKAVDSLVFGGVSPKFSQVD